MLKVIAYTGGRFAPSRVFRVQQYIEPLKSAGIDMRECPSRAGTHPPLRRWLRPLWGVCNLGERAPDTLRSFGYDLVLFQRELLSTFVTWEPLTRSPRVLDVDDAIWAHPRGGFARRLAALCDHVICGNRYLADQFSRWNPNVSVLPTPVDVHRFAPRFSPLEQTQRGADRPVIGWMGLSTNLVFLYQIENALAQVLQRHPKVVLRIVTGEPPRFRNLPSSQVEYIRWTPENEAKTMQEMTIGIMPLEDNVFARGKCSYKMLLYMACGLPVVVSPVGMNAEVLEQGSVGYAASNESEWVEHLDRLLRHPEMCSQMGAEGRKVILENYSVEALAPQMAKTLHGVSAK
jgi:glycosyltransferase involved in cell wall biosynthesis